MKGNNYKDVIGIQAYSFDHQKAPKRLLSHPADHQNYDSDQTSSQTRHNTFFFDIRKLAEMVKGKLSQGARILQVGGMERVFKKNFSLREGEKLFKASQCYLSTTAGPIAGILFITTDKVAFCSERSIKILSPSGKCLKIRYKVLIPVRKLKRANASQNSTKPSQKYIEVLTEDNFDFWFMGFVNHRRTLRCLQHAIIGAQ